MPVNAEGLEVLFRWRAESSPSLLASQAFLEVADCSLWEKGAQKRKKLDPKPAMEVVFMAPPQAAQPAPEQPKGGWAPLRVSGFKVQGFRREGERERGRAREREREKERETELL